MTRFLKWTLALAVLTTALGCGSGEDSSLDTAAPKTTSAKPNAPAPVEGKPDLKPLPPPAGGSPSGG